MQLSVSGRQVEVDGALRAHVEQRLTAGIRKYFDRAIVAQVQFSREAHLYRSDILVHAGHGITLKAHAKADAVGAAFELAADRAEKRLRRFKRRLVEHHVTKPGPEAQEIMARALQVAGTDSEAAPEEDAAGPVTIAETAPALDTLTVGQAVSRLELDGRTVLMFRNRAHGGINVVYRRGDGNIGWIDPEQGPTAPGR